MYVTLNFFYIFPAWDFKKFFKVTYITPPCLQVLSNTFVYTYIRTCFYILVRTEQFFKVIFIKFTFLYTRIWS